MTSPRYRALVAALLLVVLVWWNMDWLSESEYSQPRIHARETIEVGGQQVYASEMHKNSTFTFEGIKYRWSTLHANILQEGDARHMEVLAFLEDTTYKGPMSIHHQAIVPSNIAQVVDKITCDFEGSNTQTTASIRYEMPHAWYAVLVRCSVPSEVILPTKATVDLALRHEKVHIKHTVDLNPYTVSDRNVTSNLAFCLAPAFGELDLFKLLEWRLHHARLGVKTVHWYTRRPNGKLQMLVNILNHKEGLKDTWKEAIPISPDTFETEHLQEHGLYGDQVLYYIDCLERSKHLNPSHWLAFIDLDEYFLPDPFESSGLDDFLDLKNHSDVATICFDRNQANKASERGEETELLFEHITDLVERKEDHPTDNRKCIHRPGSLVVPFVHWPLLLREGKPSREIVYNKEGSYLRLLHASSKEYWGNKVPLLKTDSFQQHVGSLRTSVNQYLRTYSEVFQ